MDKFVFEKLERCPVCADKDFNFSFTRDFSEFKITWQKCKNCGLTFQNPRLTDASLSQLFNSKDYWNGKTSVSKGGKKFNYNDYHNGEEYRLKQAKERLKKISEFVCPPANLIEIGCATGSFIKIAEDYGFKVKGVEVSHEMASMGKSLYGAEIIVCPFEDAALRENTFDLAVLWGADGCFSDPLKIYKKINRLLKPGGFLFFNFFDFDHFSKIIRGNFKKSPSAVCNFNWKSLKTLLNKSNFRLLKYSRESQFTSVEKILSLTGRDNLLKLSDLLRLSGIIIKLPILGSYFVVAQKED